MMRLLTSGGIVEDVFPSPRNVSESEGKHPREVLQLSDDDVQINYKTPLGNGAFCMVFPVHLREASGEFKTTPPFLALKKLRYAVFQNEKIAKIAAADLHCEAQLLSKLSHKNILQVYGVRKSKQDENDAQDIHFRSFFMVMNILSDTLESKLKTWTKNRGLFERLTPHETVVIRLRDVAMGIANGLEYLHSKRIIFRDLKPDNIGFDFHCRVKIFDFGLAIELSKDGACTERAGTLRYMAPEVAASNDKPYGPPADVFSFAVLLWQISTSRIPYEAEISSFAETTPQVDGKRPPLKYVESKDLQVLLEKSWSSTPDDRPTFTDIAEELQTIISKQPPKLDRRPRKEKKQGQRQKRLLRSSLFTR